MRHSWMVVGAALAGCLRGPDPLLPESTLELPAQLVSTYQNAQSPVVANRDRLVVLTQGEEVELAAGGSALPASVEGAYMVDASESWIAVIGRNSSGTLLARIGPNGTETMQFGTSLTSFAASPTVASLTHAGRSAERSTSAGISTAGGDVEGGRPHFGVRVGEKTTAGIARSRASYI